MRRGAAHGRAGGNPFFLEEALHDLVERGALRRGDGRYALAVGADELAIPTIVQGALKLGSTGSTWKPARC